MQTFSYSFGIFSQFWFGFWVIKHIQIDEYQYPKGIDIETIVYADSDYAEIMWIKKAQVVFVRS